MILATLASVIILAFAGLGGYNILHKLEVKLWVVKAYAVSMLFFVSVALLAFIICLFDCQEGLYLFFS